MESKGIDPLAFREAQHRHWDAAAVGRQRVEPGA